MILKKQIYHYISRIIQSIATSILNRQSQMSIAWNQNKGFVLLRKLGIMRWLQFFDSCIDLFIFPCGFIFIIVRNMIQREREYFKNIFELFKKIAFHQIYMQSAREDLCKDDFYDPKTAFKCLDAFKHNQVIAYEIYSFLELHEIQSTAQQCESIIKSINKSIDHLDIESFQELTMPHNKVLKNLAATRYQYTQIEVGSYSKLCYVKEHTEHVIALFLQKQLNFTRESLILRQQFCRKWGADIFSMFQKLFKGHKQSKSINFQQFFQLSRIYGIIFNRIQFLSLWKRSKKTKTSIDQPFESCRLNFDDLANILLVNNFNTKTKYGLERNIPLQKINQKVVPSYHKSHWREHEEWQAKQKRRQIQLMKQDKKKTNYVMKYKYEYPRSALGNDMKERHDNWQQTVNKMSDLQLLAAYKRVSIKSVLFDE